MLSMAPPHHQQRTVDSLTQTGVIARICVEALADGSRGKLVRVIVVVQRHRRCSVA